MISKLSKIFKLHPITSKQFFLNVSAAVSSFISIFAITMSGCTSYDMYKYITDDFEMPTEVINADYNLTWQAIIDVINMKHYDLEHQNQEAGVIKTKWVDNTTEMNFSDSFGSSDAVKAAKFKITINVVKGFKGTKEVAKVSVYKKQFVEQDFLQGWKEIPSDNILEKTILYRVNRRIAIDRKLRSIEKMKEKEELKKF
ncbi:MAG: outer membrane protein assembly factor BamC [Oligoflexia bacterium]|nr:outer membrane protein assembly factor BamC [Oligoflexia bacterium]